MASLNEIMIFMTLRDHMSDRLGTIRSNLEKVRDAFADTNRTISSVSRAMRDAGKNMMEGAIVGMRNLQIASGILKEPLDAAVSWESGFRGVLKVAELETEASINRLKDDIDRAATTFGRPLEEVLEMYATGFRLGQGREFEYDGKGLNDFVDLVGTASIALEMNTADVARSFATWKNVVHLTNEEISSLGDLINFYDNTENTTGKAIIEAYDAVAGIVKQSGFKAKEGVAFATLLSATGTDPSSGATATKNLMLALGNYSPTGQLSESYKALGLDPTETAKLVASNRGFEAFEMFMTALRDMENDEERKHMVSKTLQGFTSKYGILPITKMLSNQETMDRIFNAAKANHAGSMAAEAGIRKDTAAMQISNLRNEIGLLMRDLGQPFTDTQRGFIGKIFEIVHSIRTWVTEHEDLIFKVGIAIAVILAFNAAVYLCSFVFGATLSSIGAVGKVIGMAVGNARLFASAVSMCTMNGMGFARSLVTSLPALFGWAGGVWTVNSAIAFLTGCFLPLIAVILAVIVIGYLFYAHWDAICETVGGIFEGFWYRVQDVFGRVWAILSKIGGFFLSVFNWIAAALGFGAEAFTGFADIVGLQVQLIFAPLRILLEIIDAIAEGVMWVLELFGADFTDYYLEQEAKELERIIKLQDEAAKKDFTSSGGKGEQVLAKAMSPMGGLLNDMNGLNIGVSPDANWVQQMAKDGININDPTLGNLWNAALPNVVSQNMSPFLAGLTQDRNSTNSKTIQINTANITVAVPANANPEAVTDAIVKGLNSELLAQGS